MMELATLEPEFWWGVGLLVAAVLCMWGYVVVRRRQEEQTAQEIAEARERNLHIPQTLHPVIDPDICIGSLSCLKACPEGDILGVSEGRAVLVKASACIGHGKCALECPVDAIKLVFGTAERGVDLPEVDEFFESSRPGVYVVGELGGMGLIKNALTQGVQVGQALKNKLANKIRSSDGDGNAVDVAIVGAGPAGIACALACKEANLRFRLLEQDTVGGTVAHYPRQKLVMTERVDLPLFGRFGKPHMSKEEMLGIWKQVLTRTGVRVEEGVKVSGIDGHDGALVLETNHGPVHARKVVLAIGRRGSPRKLNVPGEDLPKVAYRLIDPEQYEGSKVLVVGGGDSALEAAMQLAEESDAEVLLCHRSAELGKCRDANKRKFADLLAKHQLRASMSTQVKEIRPETVVLTTPKGEVEIGNDFVIVCAGGELPTEFLAKARVSLRKYFGTALGESEDAPKNARARRGSAKEEAERQRLRRLSLTLTVIGASVLGVLMFVGRDYYYLSPAQRLKSPLHAFLRPAGMWGHGVGIAATLFMMSNFLYALRKRWKRLKGRGSIRGWLTFHQFVGFMGPMVICFHAAFQSNNLLASATAASVAIVVLTGVIGRYFFGMLPTAEGRMMAFVELKARWERLYARVQPHLERLTQTLPLQQLMVLATEASTQGSLVALPFRLQRTRRTLKEIRPLFQDQGQYLGFASAYDKLLRARLQMNLYSRLRRVMSLWRVVHVVLAVALVVMIAAHVAVSLYLGYRWLFA